MLRMLDPPTRVRGLGARHERALVHIQHLAVSPVANGMHAQLVVVLQSEPRRLRQLIQGDGVEPRTRRQVRIRLQQPGAVRP